MTEQPDKQGRVVIAGGSGILGKNLARYLSVQGYEVVVVSRSKPQESTTFLHAPWDGCTVTDWAEHLDGASALVNLAGRTVDCIKTPDHCDEILRSRVDSTLALGKAIRSISNPPPVWVQMSTAHLYGDPPQGVICDEDSSFGYGLAPFVGKAWEETFAQSVLPGMRQVITRTSFVLGRTGGALQRLATLARIGLGGTVGHGRQGISWIHEEDMNRIFHRAISDETMNGAYMVTAPKPVSNREFMRELRHAIGNPIGLPAMEWMVRIGAPLVLRTDPELALYGRYCIPKRLLEEGFDFTYPDLKKALKSLFSDK